ncbi:hypothetical protein Tco_1065991 [Tanacetum coccineum]
MVVVMTSCIHSDDGNPSSVIIKQHCGRLVLSEPDVIATKSRRMTKPIHPYLLFITNIQMQEIVSLDDEEEFASFQDEYEYVGQEHKMIKKVNQDDSRQGDHARLKISRIQSQKPKEGFTLVLLEQQDVVMKFRSPSRWKELSKETINEILPSRDGSHGQMLKPIASLISKGKLK